MVDKLQELSNKLSEVNIRLIAVEKRLDKMKSDAGPIWIFEGTPSQKFLDQADPRQNTNYLRYEVRAENVSEAHDECGWMFYRIDRIWRKDDGTKSD